MKNRYSDRSADRIVIILLFVWMVVITGFIFINYAHVDALINTAIEVINAKTDNNELQ